MVVTTEYRYYLSETYAPQGVYLAPFLRYYQIDDFSILGGGLIIGKQVLFKDKVTIDYFLGPSINGYNFDGENDAYFGVRAGITIGLKVNRKQ